MKDKFLRLTNTVYKLLEFFPESDPLKNRAKEKALSIMDNLVLVDDVSGWASFQKEKSRKLVLEDIDILLGYFWIAECQGWLNSANCMILANEYEKIKKWVEPKMEFTQKLPGIEKSLTPESLEPPVSEQRTQTPDMPVLNNEVASPIVSDLDAEDEGHSSIGMSDRQEKIIDFLSKNEKAQVMDLQAILPDVTKRTIRRDLDDLLEAGRIVRLGDFNQVFYKIYRSPASVS